VTYKAEVQLAETFGNIARALLDEPDPQTTLERIVGLAVDTIDACDHASISVVHGRLISSPAATDEIPAAVERLQARTGEGPCLDAVRQHQIFQTGRLSQEHRWPNFAPRASAELHIESVLAFRLFAQADTMGALNLYSSQPDAFNDHDVAVGAVFATHAAVALSSSQRIQGLPGRMDTRGLIGQAIGLLRGRQGVSEQEAFDMLVRASQRLNIKLRVVAEQVVHGRPTEPPSPPDPPSETGHDSAANT
jgi:transcriptional regulator with GAF, ATPase, and Fis domain